jgi:hypothetical protein
MCRKAGYAGLENSALANAQLRGLSAGSRAICTEKREIFSESLFDSGANENAGTTVHNQPTVLVSASAPQDSSAAWDVDVAWAGRPVDGHPIPTTPEPAFERHDVATRPERRPRPQT